MCYWWGIRESWTFCECSSTADFLVVSVADRTQDSLNNLDQQNLLIREILEDEHVYDHALPLPDTLGQLFEGGKKQLSFCPKLDPGDKISLRTRTLLRQPTYYGPMYSYAGRGSRGTIISYEEYVLEYEQLSQAGKIDLDYTKNFQAIWFPAAKRELEKGTCHSMRLDKLEPIFFDRASGQSLSKEGEIYLVEIQDVEKCA